MWRSVVNYRLSLRSYSTHRSKVFSSADAAIHDLQSHTTFLSGGFGLCGIPSTLIDAVSRRGDIRAISAISNNPVGALA